MVTIGRRRAQKDKTERQASRRTVGWTAKQTEGHKGEEQPRRLVVSSIFFNSFQTIHFIHSFNSFIYSVLRSFISHSINHSARQPGSQLIYRSVKCQPVSQSINQIVTKSVTSQPHRQMNQCVVRESFNQSVSQSAIYQPVSPELSWLSWRLQDYSCIQCGQLPHANQICSIHHQFITIEQRYPRTLYARATVDSDRIILGEACSFSRSTTNVIRLFSGFLRSFLHPPPPTSPPPPPSLLLPLSSCSSSAAASQQLRRPRIQMCPLIAE